MLKRIQRLLQIGSGASPLRSLVGRPILLHMMEGACTLEVVQGGIHGRDSNRQLHLLSRPFLLFDDKGVEEGLKLQHIL
jgi:hypothetical protein